MGSAGVACPYCGHDNIHGSDACEACQGDLTHLDQPVAGSRFEAHYLQSPVAMLPLPAAVAVAVDCPLAQVLTTMLERHIGCVLVVEHESLRGVFTERDYLFKVAGKGGAELLAQPVSRFMTPNPETVDMGDTLALCLHKMDLGGYRHLPVMQDGHPFGVISVRDIIGLIADALRRRDID